MSTVSQAYGSVMANSDPTPRPPGDRQRFSDPAAEPVYAAIKSLDLASQHQLLRELQVKLHAEDVSAEGTQRTKVGHALTALGHAARTLATRHRSRSTAGSTEK